MSKYISLLLVLILLFSICLTGCNEAEVTTPPNSREHTDVNDDGICVAGTVISLCKLYESVSSCRAVILLFKGRGG